MLLVQKLMLEIISLSFTLASVLLIRWLLALSTPDNDWWWVQTQARHLYFYYDSLQWYRGTEYLHQLNASKIIDASIEVTEVKEGDN